MGRCCVVVGWKAPCPVGRWWLAMDGRWCTWGVWGGNRHVLAALARGWSVHELGVGLVAEHRVTEVFVCHPRGKESRACKGFGGLGFIGDGLGCG